MSDKKITFRRLGYFLVAEDLDLSKRVEIVEKAGQFNITFFLNGTVYETTRAFTLNAAKEEARKYIRGWDNLPEITGKGYKK